MREDFAIFGRLFLQCQNTPSGLIRTSFVITRARNGDYSGVYGDSFCVVTDVRVTGRNVMIKDSCANGQNIEVRNYVLSEDGKSLDGTFTLYLSNGEIAQDTLGTHLYRQ